MSSSMDISRTDIGVGPANFVFRARTARIQLTFQVVARQWRNILQRNDCSLRSVS